VTVIDATGAAPKPDMTVFVSGGVIRSISRSTATQFPAGTPVINASGKYLIPGLWDMHVHWYMKDYLPLFIANGVTGVRQMWGFPFHQEWRKQIQSEALLAPRMIIASSIIDGPNAVWQGSVSVASAEEARQAVRTSKEQGADFIKVYNRLPREAFFAIADETRKLRITFAGHVPDRITASEASDAGQRSIEHLSGILEGSSTREQDLTAKADNLRRLASGQAADPVQTRNRRRMMLETFSTERAEHLFSRLKSNHTWQVPTMTVLRSIASLDDPNLRNDPRLKYMPFPFRKYWDPTTDFRFKDKTAEDFELVRRVYKKQIEVVGMMQRAGVEILAGTDTLNPYCFPGFSLHDELVLLVQAGLTPMQAIQSATVNPARFLDLEKTLGTIQEGKVADLVLLDRNPLEDISNTQKINAVLVNGRLLNRTALDEFLAQAEASSRDNMPVCRIFGSC
jgi:hypothetical protein